MRPYVVPAGEFVLAGKRPYREDSKLYVRAAVLVLGGNGLTEGKHQSPDDAAVLVVEQHFGRRHRCHRFLLAAPTRHPESSAPSLLLLAPE
jgi:hypothetical protein